jgi:beta-galactosidase GanA
MRFSAILLTALLCHAVTTAAEPGSQPRLEKRGNVTQLIVDGKPFLILGAELHNSSGSSVSFMEPLWPKLAAVPVNTVLTPLYWELVEPREGAYDFTLVDGLLKQARQQKLKVVFLWLAAWKNGQSSYAPVWVKNNVRRFPRVVQNGNEVEILGTLGGETLKADSKAYAALMRHIKEVDSADHTVLMMQVENEVGVLGSSRDYSEVANQAFGSAVPAQLTAYLQSHRNTLEPELRELWEENGARAAGTWEQVFGASPRTDEIFMAWNYARYVQAVAAAGKAEYAIPMYVNTWLALEDGNPGDYPSGGPQPRVIDVWKAAGTAIDIYTPDIYAPNFTEWCRRYHRNGNPLFIPEMENSGGVHNGDVFYVFGELAAIGLSPFGIDSWNDTNNDLGKSYRVIRDLMPLVTDAQAKGKIHGFTLDKSHPSVTFMLEGLEVTASLDEIFSSRAEKGFGFVIATGPDEFLGAGKGFRVSFRSRGKDRVGIASIDEGRFEDGKWIGGRRLNGDQNDQGRYWRFDPQVINIEKAVLYRY